MKEKYRIDHLNLEQVPRVNWGTNEAHRMIVEGVPCILTNVAAAQKMKGKWDVHYLAKHLPDMSFPIHIGKNMDGRIQYGDDDKNIGEYNFTQDFTIKNMRLKRLARLMKKGIDERKDLLYLQGDLAF